MSLFQIRPTGTKVLHMPNGSQKIGEPIEVGDYVWSAKPHDLRRNGFWNWPDQPRLWQENEIYPLANHPPDSRYCNAIVDTGEFTFIDNSPSHVQRHYTFVVDEGARAIALAADVGREIATEIQSVWDEIVAYIETFYPLQLQTPDIADLAALKVKQAAADTLDLNGDQTHPDLTMEEDLRLQRLEMIDSWRKGVQGHFLFLKSELMAGRQVDWQDNFPVFPGA